MAFIHRALGSISPRPVLVVAPALIVLGISYHFGSQYRTCTGHAGLRQSLTDALQAASVDPARARVHLADIAKFDWDEARIQVNFKPDLRTPDCPFGWDWSRAEREALVEQDLLTVIAFARDGRIVDYLEYRRDWADFKDISNPYTQETAVFTAELEDSSLERLTVRPAAAD